MCSKADGMARLIYRTAQKRKNKEKNKIIGLGEKEMSILNALSCGVEHSEHTSYLAFYAV